MVQTETVHLYCDRTNYFKDSLLNIKFDSLEFFRFLVSMKSIQHQTGRARDAYILNTIAIILIT